MVPPTSLPSCSNNHILTLPHISSKFLGTKINQPLPVHLFLHLKRFTFNHNKNCKEKLYDYFEYYHEVDMGRYMTEESGACLYRLGGVIVHEGSIDNGHFYSIIRDRQSSASGEENYWCEVDDDWVGRFDMENLLDDTFGYQEDSDASDQDEDMDEEHLDSIPCAYILVYDRMI